MQKSAVYCFFLLSLAFLILGLTVTTAGEAHAQSAERLVDTRVAVQILDINTAQKTANVKMTLFIDNFPWNVTSLTLWITGDGGAVVTCNCMTENRNGWFYQGESNETVWFLEGSGETYPFDSYLMRFRLQSESGYPGFNFSLTSLYSEAYFDGPKIISLRDLWAQNNSEIPTSWGIAREDFNDTTLEMDLRIQRSGNAFNIAFLEFIMPIMACYYLLGATLMLDPKKQLNERLVIYVALFVFVPTFLLAIQNYLPYRSSLSFPELLLTNLIIGNAVFGVFSIVGKRKGWSFQGIKRLKNFKIHHNNWDLVGVILCLLFFILIYASTLFGKSHWKHPLSFLIL